MNPEAKASGRGQARTEENVEKLKCPRCGAGMEQGFVAEPSGAIQSWVPGQPVPGFFGRARLKGRKQRKVMTFRCAKCGCLDSYAL